MSRWIIWASCVLALIFHFMAKECVVCIVGAVFIYLFISVLFSQIETDTSLPENIKDIWGSFHKHHQSRTFVNIYYTYIHMVFVNTTPDVFVHLSDCV